jgi:hypothetical protein
MDVLLIVKELCKIAKETLQAEKELQTEVQEKSAKAALTELFLESKDDQTPAVVERIVTDIDAIYGLCASLAGKPQQAASVKYRSRLENR